MVLYKFNDIALKLYYNISKSILGSNIDAKIDGAIVDSNVFQKIFAKCRKASVWEKAYTLI